MEETQVEINQLNTILILRNDTSANWVLNGNKVLHRGEAGIELLEDGSSKIKIGDGIHTWNELPYFGGNVEDLDLVKAQVNTLQQIIGAPAYGENTATGLFAELEKKANKSDVYTKEEVNALIGSAFKYKGTVANYEDLPVEGNIIGDVWNIENASIEHGIHAGDNVAWNGSDWDRLGGTVDLTNYVTQTEFAPVVNAVAKIPELYLLKDAAKVTLQNIKYDVPYAPAGTLLKVTDEEIRVMCPKTTVWTDQTGGGEDNKYYIGFKAFAPDAAVSFKEDLDKIITDPTMYYFTNNDFAGIDNYGRKYSVVWLPAASKDAEGNWTYFGAQSTDAKYIGWYYSVEWYNAEGIVISTDTIRINLSNENCHNNPEPYYMGEINVNRLVQTEGDALILYGGGAN